MANDPTAQKNPLEQLIPLLMLAAPLVELAKPGVGFGMYQGVMQHQQRRKDERQRRVFTLARDLAGVAEENLPMAKAAFKAQGMDDDEIEATFSLARILRDPNAAAMRQLEEVIPEDVEGVGQVLATRREHQARRLRTAESEAARAREANDPLRRLQVKREIAQVAPQDVGEELGMLGVSTGPAPAPGQGVAGTAFGSRVIGPQQTPAAAARVNEVQRAISSVMLDPRVSPQIRARALALYRLSQKPDADAETLAANAESILMQAATEIGQVPKTTPNTLEQIRQKVARGGAKSLSIPEAIPGTLPRSIEDAEAQKAVLEGKLMTAADPEQIVKLARRIEALDARIMAFKQRERRGAGPIPAGR